MISAVDKTHLGPPERRLRSKGSITVLVTSQMRFPGPKKT